MKKFEDLYDTKMRNGPYQIKLAIIGCLVNLLDGSFFTISPYFARFVQLDYLMTNDDAAWLTTTLLVGTLVSGPITALLLNFVGRKFTIMMGAFIGTLTGLSFYYSNTFTFLILSNVLLSMYMLSVLTTLMIYLVETIAGPNRGRVIVGVYSFFSVGRLYGAILIKLTLSPYKFGSWKLPYLINSLIIVVMFTIILFSLRESIKYLFHKKNYEKTVKVFNEVQKANVGKHIL